MILRIFRGAVLGRPKASLLVALAVAMGTAIGTAFLGIQQDLGRKMARELREAGANILVEPLGTDELAESGYLHSEDVPKIKTVFWKHNITGVAPFLFGEVELGSPEGRERSVLVGAWFRKRLDLPGEGVSVQGLSVVAPWWSLDGDWPARAEELIVGARLAGRLGLGLGSAVEIRSARRSGRFRVSGIVRTGGFEEEQAIANLSVAQELLGLEGKISRVMVSAITVPMDDFGRRDPASMSSEEYDRWFCTAYVNAIAKDVESVVRGSRAKPIRQIADAEGAVLNKVEVTMILLTILALFSAGLAVSTSLLATMNERRREIGLMKAIGADPRQITLIFLGEAVLLAAMGCLPGYWIGAWLARLTSRVVFDSTLEQPDWLFAMAIGLALVVAILGSLMPIRRATALQPAQALGE